MIHNFPLPYRDELFYSVVARREEQMSYPSYRGVLKEVFGSTGVVVAFEFPSHLDHVTENLHPSHPLANRKCAEQLTLLPWYAPFLPQDRIEHIRSAMFASGGRNCWNRAGISASGLKPPVFLRYCPECLCEDKVVGRVPYWRRLHQMIGIDVCPEHRVFLEESKIHRLKRRYRYILPDKSLLDVPVRKLRSTNDARIGLARLGQSLLSAEWPAVGLEQLRRNYLFHLKQSGYVNGRGEVRMHALLHDLQSFYNRGTLEDLGCRRQHWVVRITRSSISAQQPIRHLLLLNFLGLDLKDFFSPQVPPDIQKSPLVARENLVCVNHLCPQHGNSTSVFIRDEISSMLGGVIETYSCSLCGQVQARCTVGSERTWVRDYGHVWRSKLIDLWADESLGLRAISHVLQVSCDTTRKAALNLGLPLSRKGHKTLSVQSYPHLVIPKAERRRRKIDRIRREWLENKERYPKLGMRDLREINPAVYATLYRYDREWLRANQPPRKVRALVVDWDERDRNLCRKLESAACDRTAVTQYKLTRNAGINGWVSDRLAKLPRARQTLQRLLGSDRTKAPPIAIVDGTHQE